MFTDKFDVYRSEWLELVFANRNHEYGAYELRKNYSHTLNKALIAASFLFTSVICLPMLLYHLKEKPAAMSDFPVLPPMKETVVDLSRIKQVEPAEAAPKAEPVKIKTTRFVPPRVVVASQVTEEMPEIRALQATTIATHTQEGIEVASSISPVQTDGTGGNGNSVNGSDNSGNDVEVFVTVEKFPEFQGGMEGFAKYLRKNLRYPASAAESNISGRVYLSFIVEKDGSLTDIKVLKGIGFGCDEEAVRVLKKSPAWTPGIQNKQKVRVQYTLPIVFSLGE